MTNTILAIIITFFGTILVLKILRLDKEVIRIIEDIKKIKGTK